MLAALGRYSPWCTQQSVPVSTRSHRPASFLSYPDQKVAPEYFFILLDRFITEILLWQFPFVLRSFEVSSQTHTSLLYFHAVSLKLASFTLAYNKACNRARIPRFSLVRIWTCQHSCLLPLSHGKKLPLSLFKSVFLNSGMLNGQQDLKIKMFRHGLIGGKLKGNLGLLNRKVAFVRLLVDGISFLS